MGVTMPSSSAGDKAQRNSEYSRAPSAAVSFHRYGFEASILGLLHAFLVGVVNGIVREPYMDEIFHVDQTRRYCQGNWSWNPMITTPPALYVVALPLCHGWERFANSFFIPFLYIGCTRLGGRVAALSVVTLPVLLHSSVLFYTDTLSLTAVVWALSLKVKSSSLLFLFSLLCRQTNIIWAAFYAGKKLAAGVKRQDSLTLLGVAEAMMGVFPFLMLALGFGCFVAWNEGRVVLGDASAHAMVPHGSQLLYLAAFCCVHVWPKCLECLDGLAREAIRPVGVVLLGVCWLCLSKLSFAHPYLLADNRHVPFYIHRWFLSRQHIHPVVAVLATVSLLAMSILSRQQSRFSRLLFLLCSALSVVPAHLIEFRYFIVPFAVWRLSLCSQKPSFFAAATEIASNIAVFTFVFMLFLFKPFEWPSEPGVNQRFMW